MSWVGGVLSTLSMLLLVLGSLMVRHNRRRAPRLEDASAPLGFPKVSLLIPARNEADNLRVTLSLLLQSSYPNWELIVLNDNSTDGTQQVIDDFVSRSQGVMTCIQGKPLSSGWNGKNWACSQLAEAATGDILLFCDADVHVGSQAIAQTVSTLQHRGAGVLTVIPHQQLVTWSEKAIVPLVMHFPTLGSVPLQLASSSLRPSLTVANGQWLAFQRQCYDRIGGHEAVKDAIVEDMVLCKRVKQLGMRVCTVLAFSQLSVRMYHNFQGIREGFGKNLYALVQYQWLTYFVVASVFFIVAILPWVMPFFSITWGILPLVSLLWMRIELAVTADHSWHSIVLHPLGAVALFFLSMESMWLFSTNRLQWKERRLLRPV